MPELIHSFIKGKMNKDLDERLVPNGEYRDALNLEVTTSDGSDVGSLQTLHGNSQRINRTYNSTTQTHQTWADSGLPFIQDTAVCVGVKKDPTTEKIYWFISDTTEQVSAIAEYDQVNDVVYPIIVDKNNILNFSENFLITGINILEGFLFWTDNQYEPKKIEISKFKSGSTDFDTHTQVHGADFTEEYITVIKKYPLASPTIYKKSSLRDGLLETATGYEFSAIDVETDEPEDLDFGTEITLTFTDAVSYVPGDFLLLREQDKPYDYFKESNQVRLKVEQVVNTFTFLCSIQKIGEDVITGFVSWDVILEQDDPMFEFKFPRFAFRYKYDDNQFSSFSPFSQIAFIPGKQFEYSGSEGYNLAMTNNVRVLEIRDFVPNNIPEDVVAIDILYKDTSSTNVYRVDTIEKNAPNIPGKSYNQWNDVSYYEPGDTQLGSGRLKIETELISSLLPSNQLIRPYDNVPKKALAQEIIGNRLKYGNYTQNFNMVDVGGQDVLPSFEFSIVHDSTKNETLVPDPDNPGEFINETPDPIAGVAVESLKSMRTYQMGVVYLDKYGRQSPVFTDDSGSRDLPKEFADLYNTINVKLVNNPPKWAEGYKFYIKETSNQYYNLALDRVYITETDDVWLSFASADRNKVDEETFLELKKRHDSDIFVSEKARYKILSISNEAPEALKIDRKLLGSIQTNFNNNASDRAKSDRLFFKIPEADYELVFSKEDGPSTMSDLKCSISNGSNTSVVFQITSLEKIAVGSAAEYRFQLEEPIGDSLLWYDDFYNSTTPAPDVSVNIFQTKIENKPEFEGRFFVKIYKDLTLDENLLNIDDLSSYVGVAAADAAYIVGTGRSPWWDRAGDINRAKKWFGDEVEPNNVTNVGGDKLKYETSNIADVPSTGLGIGVGSQQITLSYHGFGNPWEQPKAFYNRLGIWWNFPSNDPGSQSELAFANKLDTAGSKFRIPGDPDETIYEITQVYRSAYTVDSKETGKRRTGRYGSRRVVRWNITIDKPIAWIPTEYNTPTQVEPFASENSSRSLIEFVEVYFDTSGSDFTSLNPAVFETYPKEAVDLDLYHSASDVYDIINPGTSTASHQPTTRLPWFNCYSFGQGIESNRIRDDFNQPIIDKGPVVSTVLDETYAEEKKPTSLIFSQIFNSTSGINRLNQFIAAEPITKDLNPYYTSVQKLHARDTDLITLCEDKILKVLANKDALYNADGNTNIVGNTAVLGQSIPFVGEYGISKNPESFASYGFRAYFTDKNRGVVLRLSRNGLEEISSANMSDFFSNNLHASKRLLGSYDDDKNVYNLTLDTLTSEWQTKLNLNRANPSLTETGTTISFSEDVRGWTSRKDFIPESAISLNNTYYSLNKGKIWKHGDENVDRNNFYGVQYDSSIKFLINEAPNSVKKFKTLNYSGTESKEYTYNISGDSRKFSLAQIQASNLDPISFDTTEGWYCNNIATNLQDGSVKEFLDKEGKYFNYIKGLGTKTSELDSREFSMQGVGTPSSITGDLQVDYNLNLIVDPNCITSSFTATSTTVVVEEGTNLNTLSNSTITISPAQGFNLDSSQMTASYDPEIDAVGFAQDGENIVVTVTWADYIMPSNELTVEICLLGNFATEQEFTLNPTLRITETGEVTPSSQDIVLTPVSGIAGSSVVVATQTVEITPASIGQYYFQETPFIFVNTGDASRYTLTASNEVYTNTLLTSIDFTITYEFASENSSDIIEIVANSKAIGQSLVSYTFSKAGISCAGETRQITVTGSPGYTFTVEGLSNNPSYVPQFQTNNGNTNEWDVVIDSSGSATNNVIFAAQTTVADVDFTFNFLTESGGTMIPLEKPNPLIREQMCATPPPAPVITILGRSTIDITKGSTYQDQGATALDSIDGDITSSIVTVDNVNTGTLGTQYVTYDVTNSGGVAATQATRTVIVTPPFGSISSSSTVTSDCSLALANSVYIDASNEGVITNGDTIYTSYGLTPVAFVGDGDFYTISPSSSGIKYTAQISASGVVTNVSDICL